MSTQISTKARIELDAGLEWLSCVVLAGLYSGENEDD